MGLPMGILQWHEEEAFCSGQVLPEAWEGRNNYQGQGAQNHYGQSNKAMVSLA